MKRWAKLLIVVAVCTLIAVSILLLIRAGQLDRRDGTLTADEGAVLQAYAAAAASLGTAALVAVTAFYAQLTARILESSGPIVVVELLHAWMQPGGQAVVTGPVDGPLNRGAFDPSFSDHFFAACVRNRGNGAVTIDSIDFDLKAMAVNWTGAPPIGPSCPHRLDPHSRETFYIDARVILDCFDALKVKKGTLRVRAVLASGDTVASPWVRVTPS